MAPDKPLEELVESARAAARALGVADAARKDRALEGMAAALRARSGEIRAANAEDVEAARKDGKPAAFVDRLMLDGPRIEGMARAVEEVVQLPDPIGEVVEKWKRPNGLQIQKVRLPLGVVLMIYESRPNVTSDAAALCLKSGNAVILRGGSESFRSNRAIAQALHQGIEAAGLPPASVQLVPSTDREALLELIRMEGRIDLCIPRGGEGLIRFVAENARVPVVKHYKGVCHVYVHQSADQKMAAEIIVNAKAQRPGVCNAAECLLVDRAVADAFLPVAGRRLREKGVELRGCPTTVTVLRRAGVEVVPAAPDDYGREFLDLILAVRVVKDLDQALDHIARHGSEHTEAIITQDEAAADRFTREVTASGVMVNASTRFNDGGELGLGAEIGISTSRLHAFGPMGLRELTAQKYVVHGKGQVR
ncbi:MAG TPA: glutamate-5-semialdehyde dehydrogenase [Myxococcales bacterium]|nr:glutamate-5-semialdehyde dehydrogenase [Myxococcales bacterium]